MSRDEYIAMDKLMYVLFMLNMINEITLQNTFDEMRMRHEWS